MVQAGQPAGGARGRGTTPSPAVAGWGKAAADGIVAALPGLADTDVAAEMVAYMRDQFAFLARVSWLSAV